MNRTANYLNPTNQAVKHAGYFRRYIPVKDEGAEGVAVAVPFGVIG